MQLSGIVNEDNVINSVSESRFNRGLKMRALWKKGPLSRVIL